MVKIYRVIARRGRVEARQCLAQSLALFIIIQGLTIVGGLHHLTNPPTGVNALLKSEPSC